MPVINTYYVFIMYHFLDFYFLGACHTYTTSPNPPSPQPTLPLSPNDFPQPNSPQPTYPTSGEVEGSHERLCNQIRYRGEGGKNDLNSAPPW